MREGGGVAEAIREQLGIQSDLRKSRTCFRTTEDGKVVKSAPGPGPRSDEMRAALRQYADQLGNPGSVPVGQAAPLARVAEQGRKVDEVGAAGALTPSPYDDEDLPPKSFVGPSHESAVVRKVRAALAPQDARAADDLIEKAASESLDAEGLADPVQTLGRTQQRLLDTFRKAEGRDPLPEDTGYWSAYKQVLGAFARRVKRDAP